MTNPANLTPSSGDLTPEEVAAVNAARARLGLPPVMRKHAKRPRMMSISDEAYENLSRLAADVGYVRWTGGNVSHLIEAIGQGQYALVPVTELAEKNKLDQDGNGNEQSLEK